MEIIKSNKGGEKVCFSGYLYTKQIEKNDYIRWRCSRRSENCKGILKTTTKKEFPEILKEHNHPPNEELVEVTKCRAKMKSLATEGNEKPGQIFAKSVVPPSSSAESVLPSEEICKRTIRNQKSAGFPRQPQSIDEIEIPNPFKVTGGSNPERFLLFDNGRNSNSRIIAFATNDALKLLSEASVWMMDGNFKMAPKFFMQLYIIRVPFGEFTISTVFCFLEKKNQETYEELFQTLIVHCQEKSLSPDPSKIIIDFEIAVFNAIKSTFGNEVHIQGCFFHLTQNTWRKIQELGLTTVYKTNADFRTFCCMLNALAFLPVDDVKEGMKYLREIVPPGAEDLIEYFDATYVSGGYRQRRRNESSSIIVRRTQPIFSLPQWNVHDATLNDDPRTNNQCEGWNNKFHHLVGHSHPTIWKAIKTMQEEVATVEVMLAQHSVGNIAKKKTKRVYIHLQQRLQNLCEQYTRDNLRQFLQSVAKNIQLVPH